MMRTLLSVGLVSLVLSGCASSQMDETDGTASAIATLPNGHSEEVVAQAKTYLDVDFTPSGEVRSTASGIDTWTYGAVNAEDGAPVAFLVEGRKSGARVDRIVVFAGSDGASRHSVVVGERATSEQELKDEFLTFVGDLQGGPTSPNALHTQAFGVDGCGTTVASAALLAIVGLGVAGVVVVCTASTAGLCLGGIAASGGLATTGSVVSWATLMGAAANGIAAVGCAGGE